MRITTLPSTQADSEVSQAVKEHKKRRAVSQYRKKDEIDHKPKPGKTLRLSNNKPKEEIQQIIKVQIPQNDDSESSDSDYKVPKNHKSDYSSAEELKEVHEGEDGSWESDRGSNKKDKQEK